MYERRGLIIGPMEIHPGTDADGNKVLNFIWAGDHFQAPEIPMDADDVEYILKYIRQWKRENAKS